MMIWSPLKCHTGTDNLDNRSTMPYFEVSPMCPDTREQSKEHKLMRNNAFLACLASMMVAIGATGCGVDTKGPAGGVRSESADDPSVSFADGSVGLTEEGGVPSWQSDSFIQSYNLQDWRYVTITDSTLNPSGSWNSVSYDFSASFDIHAACSRGKNEFYFAGLAANGDVTVQKWKMKNAGIVGGGSRKRMVKTELYRGTTISNIRSLGADPDSRFVLLLAGSGSNTKLYQLPISANATPSVLFSTGPTMPLQDMQFIARYDHVSLGRLWTFTRKPEIIGGILIDNTAIALSDINNDGIFDATYVDQLHNLVTAGILGIAGWAGDVDSSW